MCQTSNLCLELQLRKTLFLRDLQLPFFVLSDILNSYPFTEVRIYPVLGFVDDRFQSVHSTFQRVISRLGLSKLGLSDFSGSTEVNVGNILTFRNSG